MVHVGLGEYTTLVLHEHDLVRTGGPALSVLELAPFSEAGARGVELELWAELATTADRAHRARLLDAIWEHAAKRVGGQAAEALIAIADTEAHLAASTATGQPAEVAWQPSRRAIAARFFGIGVLLMLPTLPMSLWASWVLDAAAAFLLIDGIAYALGYRRDWRTALRCKHTGHRLMSARHRRSPGRCGPSSWQIASQMTRRTS